jgi:hypothetical protein
LIGLQLDVALKVRVTRHELLAVRLEEDFSAFDSKARKKIGASS